MSQVYALSSLAVDFEPTALNANFLFLLFSVHTRIQSQEFIFRYKKWIPLLSNSLTPDKLQNLFQPWYCFNESYQVTRLCILLLFSVRMQTTFSGCSGCAQDAPGCSECEPILFADVAVMYVYLLLWLFIFWCISIYLYYYFYFYVHFTNYFLF